MVNYSNAELAFLVSGTTAVMLAETAQLTNTAAAVVLFLYAMVALYHSRDTKDNQIND